MIDATTLSEMRAARIVARNYRGFGAINPITLPLAPGFTSIVGANNAGKTTALRMMFEMRELFRVIPAHSDLRTHLSDWCHAQVLAVADPEQIFFRGQERDIDVLIEFIDRSGFSPYDVHTVRFRRQRRAGYWRLSAATDQRGLDAPFKELRRDGDWITMAIDEHGGQSRLDFRQMRTLMNILANAHYYGASRGTDGEGRSYFDITTGTAFVSKWTEWAEGASVDIAHRAQLATQTLAKIFGFRSLSITANADGKSLNVHADGVRYAMNEMGTGFQHFFHTLASAAVGKPSMILIDEPEMNLHPAMQPVFLEALGSLTKHKSVIFATHSIGLARSIAERTFVCDRGEDQRLHMRLYDSHPELLTALGELSYSMAPSLGYSILLLVEGPTEVRALRQLLALWAIDREVVLVSLGGTSMISRGRHHELHELVRVAGTARVWALIDGERESADQPLPDARREFLDDCMNAGIVCHVLERRALENYFTQASIDTVTRGKKALGPYEARGKLSWPKSTNWAIAANLRRADLETTDLGLFLDRLEREVRSGRSNRE